MRKIKMREIKNLLGIEVDHNLQLSREQIGRVFGGMVGFGQQLLDHCFPYYIPQKKEFH